MKLTFKILIYFCFVLASCQSESETKTRGDHIIFSNDPDVIDGKLLQEAFPDSLPKFQIYVTHSAVGMVKAKVINDSSKVIASSSIIDLLNHKNEISRFKKSELSFEDYPLLIKGQNSIAILVADRFQVQIKSLSQSFNDDRIKERFKQFDLEKLKALSSKNIN
ncbi:hypothetical protein [Sediminitomix flava]|uniref:Uncharacterized protein n=1 Tax=Sediminitomix flava TaxID=379075 RepID=A0A315Z850_SEDFL|nr:hypothetical protein [Sediminitomix flava]PWJ40926.1 hypothetical protein BC781_104192 [Sediminitomix flava]